MIRRRLIRSLPLILFLAVPLVASTPVVPAGDITGYKHGQYPSWGLRTHAGVDIGAPCGSEIYAFADGTVVDVVDNQSNRDFAERDGNDQIIPNTRLGYMVMIEHPAELLGYTFYSFYIHLQDPPLVAKRTTVVGGKTVIGKIGKTGAANDSCHLHFEIRHFRDRYFLGHGWRSIYGTGDRRNTTDFQDNWLDPEKLFERFPNGLTGAVEDKSLVRVANESKVYWVQNRKAYHVLGQDLIQTDLIQAMSSLPDSNWGWDNIREYPPDALRIGGLPVEGMLNRGPAFLTPETTACPSQPCSNGLLLREHGDDDVFFIENGRRRLIPSAEAFEAEGYRWDDVIEVTAQVLRLIPEALGEKPTGSVTGRIMLDTNQNGAIDSTDKSIGDATSLCAQERIPGIIVRWMGAQVGSTSPNQCAGNVPLFKSGKISLGTYRVSIDLPAGRGWRVVSGNNAQVIVSKDTESRIDVLIQKESQPLTLSINKDTFCLGDEWVLTVGNAPPGRDVFLTGWLNGSIYFDNMKAGTTDGQGGLAAPIRGLMSLGTEGNWLEQVTVTGERSNTISFQVANCQTKSPVISLDRAKYCVGDSWTLRVSNGRANSPIDLHGATNGIPWSPLPAWKVTDQNGTRSVGDTFQTDGVGNHSLSVVVGGEASNTVDFSTVRCSSLQEPTITGSLQLGQFGPYITGHRITARFDITNNGIEAIKFDVLTVGGRDPDGLVADFTWLRNIPLNSGETHSYFGAITLKKQGKYHFFTAYRTPDDRWNPAVPTAYGVTNIIDIGVAAPPSGTPFPQVGITPGSRMQGGCFDITGSGFSQGMAVALHFRRLNTEEETVVTRVTDATGDFTYFFCTDANTPIGSWEHWVIDDRAQTRSNTVRYEVTAAPSLVVRVSPLSGTQGTVFFLLGENFTSNDTARLHVLDPNQREILNVDFPVVSGGRFQYTFETDSRTTTGAYKFWAVDNFTKKTGPTVSFDVTAPEITQKPPERFSLSASTRCSGTSPEVVLSWTASTGAQNYDVRRQIDFWEIITTLSAPTREFIDSQVLANRSIIYEISALNQFGSTLSNPITLTTPICSPSSGTIEVQALLDGNTWRGPVDFSLSNIDANKTVHSGSITVPTTFSGQPVGNYQLTYTSGGPPGAKFDSVSPGARQKLDPQKTVMFTLVFKSITESEPLTIDTQSLPGSYINREYSVQLSAIGGVPPYTWSATGLPIGVSIGTNNGVISGFPEKRGTYTVNVRVSDLKNASVEKVFSLTISYWTDLRITTLSLPTGTVGKSYRASVEAVGGSEKNYQWSQTSGALPVGLIFQRYSCDLPAGTCASIVEGTPTQAGSYTFTARVTDSDSNTASTTYTVVINAAQTSLTIQTGSLPTGTVGQSYSATLSASGGTGSGYLWSLGGGTLVSGLTLSATGMISGTPTATNDCSSNFSTRFTVRVTDSASNSATRNLCISVFVPTARVDSVSPPYLTIDGQNHTITVTGANFTSGAKIYLGTDLATTFVSATILTATLYSPRDSLAAFATSATGGVGYNVGTYDLYVVVPGANSPTNRISFSIRNPSPHISAVSALQSGGSPCRVNQSCRLTINGTGFVPDTGISVSNISESVSIQAFPSPPLPWTQIASTLFTPRSSGTFTVTVNNPNTAPGASTQSSLPFSVNP